MRYRTTVDEFTLDVEIFNRKPGNLIFGDTLNMAAHYTNFSVRVQIIDLFLESLLTRNVVMIKDCDIFATT